MCAFCAFVRLLVYLWILLWLPVPPVCHRSTQERIFRQNHDTHARCSQHGYYNRAMLSVCSSIFNAQLIYNGNRRARAHTINLPLNDKMIIHTHNGWLLELVTALYACAYLNSKNEWNKNGHKRSKKRMNRCTERSIIHGIFRTCWSPSLPIVGAGAGAGARAAAANNKNDFYEFSLFDVVLLLLAMETVPIAQCTEQIELKWMNENMQ